MNPTASRLRGATSLLLALTACGGPGPSTPPATAPPPLLATVAPAQGPAAGGTIATLVGAGFVAPLTVTFGGAAATVVGTSAGTVTVITPPHGAGPVAVSLSNADGQHATLAGGFTYATAAVVPPPTLTGVAPGSGPVAGGTVVTLAGSGFVPGPGGSTVTFGGAAASVTSRTASTLVVTTPAHPSGARDVVVTNPDGQVATLAGGFSFVDPPPGPPAPTLGGVSPSSGPTAGGAQVTLTGTNFVSGGVVTFGGVAASILEPVFPTVLTVTTPAHAAGAVDVTWANPLTGQVASLQDGYTFAGPPPVIDVLSVRGAPPAGGTTLNILGSGFQPGVTATFGGAPGSGLVVSAATPPRQYLTLTTPPQPTGAGAFVDLVIRNPDGQSATFPGFHYGPPPGVAAVVVAAPGTLGNVHRGDAITITGADFGAIPGVQVQIGLFAVIASATATELVVVAPKNNPGTYQVVVTNTDGQFGVAPPAFDLVYQGP